MPFSIISHIKNINKNKKILPYSLQVSRHESQMKRVFLSASYKGSITVEAAIVATTFLLLVMPIVGFLGVIKLQQDIHIVLDNIARRMSQTIYYEEQLYETGENTEFMKKIKAIFEEKMEPFSEEDKKELLEKINDVAFDTYVYIKFVSEVGIDNIQESYILGGLTGLDFTNSKYDKEKGKVDIQLRYFIKLPYVSQNVWCVEDCQTVSIKVWSGKSLRNNKKTVYITENGNVYHDTDQCKHINIDVEKVLYRELAGLKNDSNSLYKDCEICGIGKYEEDSCVYITDTGGSFHSTLSCRGISRTVIAIDISEVEERVLCKTCQEN